MTYTWSHDIKIRYQQMTYTWSHDIKIRYQLMTYTWSEFWHHQDGYCTPGTYMVSVNDIYLTIVLMFPERSWDVRIWCQWMMSNCIPTTTGYIGRQMTWLGSKPQDLPEKQTPSCLILYIINRIISLLGHHLQMTPRVSVNFISLVSSCTGLHEEEPQIAFTHMAFTCASHIASCMHFGMESLYSINLLS